MLTNWYFPGSLEPFRECRHPCPQAASLKFLLHQSVPQNLCAQEAIFGHPGSLQDPLLSLWGSWDLDTEQSGLSAMKPRPFPSARLSYIFLKVEVEGQPMWPTLYHLQDWHLLPRCLLRLTLSGSRPWRTDTLCISLCPTAYCFPKNPKCTCKSISWSFSTRPAAREAWPLRTSITPSQAEPGLFLNFVYTRFDWYYIAQPSVLIFARTFPDFYVLVCDVCPKKGLLVSLCFCVFLQDMYCHVSNPHKSVMFIFSPLTLFF